jgi:lipoyl synthase
MAAHPSRYRYRYRYLYSSLPPAVKCRYPQRTPHLVRAFATAVSNPDSTTPPQRSSSFRDRLASGPTFSDFIVNGKGPRRRPGALGDIIEVGDDTAPLSQEEALELGGGHEGQAKGIRKAMVGPPGKQKEITRLPEWLKTPIPTSDNFKKIKNDLRGLNLHTGGSTELYNPLMHLLKYAERGHRALC